MYVVVASVRLEGSLVNGGRDELGHKVLGILSVVGIDSSLVYGKLAYYQIVLRCRGIPGGC